MGQEIHKEAKVGELKQPKPEESKSRQASICEGTLVARSRAPGKVTLEFHF
jgi:hypothetical protein